MRDKLRRNLSAMAFASLAAESKDASAGAHVIGRCISTYFPGIAKLLEQNPELKLGHVGHTDATENVDYNMALSWQRAESVVDF